MAVGFKILQLMAGKSQNGEKKERGRVLVRSTAQSAVVDIYSSSSLPCGHKRLAAKTELCGKLIIKPM